MGKWPPLPWPILLSNDPWQILLYPFIREERLYPTVKRQVAKAEKTAVPAPGGGHAYCSGVFLCQWIDLSVYRYLARWRYYDEKITETEVALVHRTLSIILLQLMEKIYAPFKFHECGHQIRSYAQLHHSISSMQISTKISPLDSLYMPIWHLEKVANDRLSKIGLRAHTTPCQMIR